jgi:hypothetical protein
VKIPQDGNRENMYRHVAMAGMFRSRFAVSVRPAACCPARVAQKDTIVTDLTGFDSIWLVLPTD